MGFDFLSQAARFLQERKAYKRWLAVFLCLALVVTSGTFAMLKMYGQAMTHQVKVLDCQYEVHVHTEECYEEDEEGNRVLVCEHADEAEYVIHIHNDDCYDQKGNLVCPLQEHEPHEHDDDCREEEEVLICEEEETEGSTEEKAEDVSAESADAVKAEEKSEAESRDAEKGSDTETVKELACEKEEHTHDDSCYEGGTGCEKEEHEHGDGCYEQTRTLICETAEHEHGDGCYSDGETVQDCELGEHSHDDGCYDEEGGLTCEEEEHTHDDSCYSTTEGGLTCEEETHTHGDGCYEVTETLTCEKEAHTHDDSCDAERELTCGTEEHEHDDSCYVETEAETEEKADSEAAEEAEEEETAAAEAAGDNEGAEEGHTHTEDCYETEEVLACGELELHTHEKALVEDGGCYDKSAFDEDGEFIEGSRPVCGLLQLEEHVHTEECFRIVELTPEEIAALENGAELHIHTEDCYDEEGNLICGHDATHLHVPECYDDSGKLICGYGTASHVHENSCYDEEGNLICGYETASHVHEDSCYDAEGNLICGYETASHVHEDGCYDEAGNLICGYETASHVHDDSCYDEEGRRICGYKTASHVHDDSCYDEEGNLICGYETATHEHDDSCYDEEGNLVCGYETAVHEHDAGCYDGEGNLVCGYENARDHEHDSNCYDGNGRLICGYAGVRDHEHVADCYDIMGNLICGYEGAEAHVHTDSCYDEEGNLICGYEVLEVYDTQKVYENENYIVVVRYNSDAEIPEEAELIAEEITPDSDEEHYGNRETEYRKMMEDTTASMRALLKIGFYLEGEEVEPATPVAVSIQFLDEDGLEEGRPITVIHFAHTNTEKLDGSAAKGNRTSFKMSSFSEIAIGYGPEEEGESKVVKTKVRVSKSAEYEDPMFHATFQVEGEILIPDELLNAENGGLKPEEILDPEEGIEASEGEETEGETEETNSVETDQTDPAAGEDTAAEADESVDGKTAENSAEDAVPAGDIAENSAEDVVVLTEEALAGTLEFVVEPLKEEAEEYKAAEVVYGEGTEEIFLNRVLSYYLSYNGTKLDLTDSNVTMEVTPTQALVDYAEETTAAETDDGQQLRDEVTLSIIDFVDTKDAEKSSAGTEDAADPISIASDDLEDGAESEDADQSGSEEETSADDEDSEGSDKEDSTEAVSTDETDPEKNAADSDSAGTDGSGLAVTGEILDAVSVTSRAMSRPMMVTLNARGTDNAAAATVTSQANPEFTVEFYAEIKRFAEEGEEGENSIPVIDTSGGVLPINDGKQTLKQIYLTSDNEVKTQDRLEEIYTSSKYNYISAPGLVYFNKIAKNDNYMLKEIRIQRKGSDEWTTYDCKKKEWHFTNKQQTQQDAPDKFILITSESTIRLVYTVKKDTVSNGVDFYDYDISDGNLYSKSNETSEKVNRGDATVHDDGKEWHMYTNRQGINSNLLDQTLGFGNNNTATTMGTIEGNMANAANASSGKATFGLVTKLQEDGTIQYASHVKAPALFNEASQNVTGKTSYVGNLIFNQEGDTYTLTKAEVTEKNQVVSSVSDLDIFNRQQWNYNNTYYFAANDFYPLDDVKSAGTKGHDLKFGSKGSTEVLNTFSDSKTSKKVPASDDGQNHNHYFGMHYIVEFDLVEDYIGPLEYLFYGDDDMWVFLDGPGYSGKLICDIGGVHSSIGEYVNLWDYISKGSEGHYKLSFFYTERGASGSTCWMQFTLPSVSFATTEQDTGELKIQKKVTGGETSEEFGFTIEFKDSGEKPLMDDYSYTKFDSEGNVIENDILIWNNSKFTLKAGEYIIIKFLPEGSTYTINEIGPVVVNSKEPGVGIDWTVSNSNPYIPEINGSIIEQGTITGNVVKGEPVQIEYNNIQKTYELPETGGPGSIPYTAAGALILLLSAGFMYRKKFSERRV